MREHLIGYLLGALEPSEHAAVEAHLERDAELRMDLRLLGCALHPLAVDKEPHQPPRGLAARTCRAVMDRAQVIPLSERLAAPSRWQWQDLTVAAGVLVAASLLFAPAVNQSRFRAQVAGCQNHLRRLGQAMMQYSDAHGGYFPYVPKSGSLAAAGLYGPIMVHGGFLPESQSLLCPGKTDSGASRKLQVPTVLQIRIASPQQRRKLARRMGGDYGYTFGYTLNGKYFGTRNLGRQDFALLSDAPSGHLPGYQSDNHGGSGQNVLFEDGRVRFLKSCTSCDLDDNFFTNGRGVVGAGIHHNDSAIGASASPP